MLCIRHRFGDIDGSRQNLQRYLGPLSEGHHLPGHYLKATTSPEPIARVRHRRVTPRPNPRDTR
jgi:hypothetical protein